MSFTLHPMLAADTFEVARLALCRVLLMNDATYPWLILVPQRDGLRDLHDLPAGDHAGVMAEIARVSNVLQKIHSPHKINVAALGNVVEQLHIHVIARFEDDPAWPAPVWGMTAPVPYDADVLKDTTEKLKTALG